MMDAVIDQSAEHKLTEVVIGMPHRGRLNVLANIVGKPYPRSSPSSRATRTRRGTHGSGDVKYHLGAEGKYYQMFGDNEITVSLTANPPFGGGRPVLEGLVRAKQDLLGDSGSEFPVLPADAARRRRVRRAGRGRGDPEPGDAARLPRRRHRAHRREQPGRIHHGTGVLALLGVLHRRREDDRCADLPRQRRRPGGVRVGGKLAVDYRETYHRDVVIDPRLLPPPRSQRGRRPVDDPAGDVRRDRHEALGVRKAYTEDLIGRGDISTKEAEDALRDYQGQLERVFNEVKELERYTPEPSPSVETEQSLPSKLVTAVPAQTLARIGDAFMTLPDGFTPHPAYCPCSSAARRSRVRAASTGHSPSCWPSARWCSRAARSACPGRTPAAARSPSAIRC